MSCSFLHTHTHTLQSPSLAFFLEVHVSEWEENYIALYNAQFIALAYNNMHIIMGHGATIKRISKQSKCVDFRIVQ